MRLYRHHIATFLQALIVLGTFASCVRDKFVEDSDCFITQDSDKTLYFLSLKFMNTSGTSVGNTRADQWDEFVQDKEHVVGDDGNYILLLKEDKSLYGVYPLRLTESDREIEDTEEAVFNTRFYHDETKELPKYCLVVLNANETVSNQLESLEEGCSKEELYSIDWDGTGENDPKEIGFGKGNGDNPELFTMTNSVYVENGNVIDAQIIPEASFATSLPEAQKNTVTVYVERMVAKFEFEVEGNGNDYCYTPTYNGVPDQIEVFSHYYTEDDIEKDEYINGNPEYVPVNYKIRITGWGINGLETKNRLFKNIIQDESITLNNFHNHSSYHHSCWSEDSYYEDKRPWQYLEAVERNLNYYSDDESTGKFIPLKNYPFEDFVEQSFKEGKIIYVPENTYGGEALSKDAYDGRTNLLAGTHLILCAQLEIGDKGATTAYRDRIGYYYYTERECFAELVRRFNNALASQDTMRYTYYQWPEKSHDTTRDNNTRYVAKPSKGGYQLYYNGEPLTHTRILDKNSDVYSLETFFIPATVKDGDGRLIPWIESWIEGRIERLSIQNEKGEKLKVRDPSQDTKNGKGEIELAPYDIEIDTDDIISVLYEWVGPVDYFNTGKMYYAAPIKHYAVNKEENEISQYTLGDFGVVRNHWYKFTLKGINTLGIPIANSQNAIVPNSDGDRRQLNLKVEILDWHEIESVVPIL